MWGLGELEDGRFFRKVRVKLRCWNIGIIGNWERFFRVLGSVLEGVGYVFWDFYFRFRLGRWGRLRIGFCESFFSEREWMIRRFLFIFLFICKLKFFKLYLFLNLIW